MEKSLNENAIVVLAIFSMTYLWCVNATLVREILVQGFNGILSYITFIRACTIVIATPACLCHIFKTYL